MLAFSLQKVSHWVWCYRGNGNNSWYFTAMSYMNFRQQLWKCIISWQTWAFCHNFTA